MIRWSNLRYKPLESQEISFNSYIKVRVIITSKPWHGHIWRKAKPRICLTWSVFCRTESKVSLTSRSSRHTVLFICIPCAQNYNSRAMPKLMCCFLLVCKHKTVLHSSLKLALVSSKLARAVLKTFCWDFFFFNLFWAQLSLRSMHNYLSKQVIYLCSGLTKIRLYHSLNTSLLSVADAPLSLTINHLGFSSSAVYPWLPRKNGGTET